MTSLFLIFAIVFFASVIQSGTGFGFSILSTPFLLMLLEPHSAIQLNIFLSLVISLIMTIRNYHHVDGRILLRLIKGSLFGIIPGLLIFIFLDLQALKILVSLIILASTILLVLRFNIKKSPAGELGSGALSGLLSSSIGVPGPPLLIYFAGAHVDKATLRSTTLAYFIFIYMISLLLQFFIYGISATVWTSSLPALPFTILGMYCGQWLFMRLNQSLFLKIIYLLLFFTAIYLLISALSGDTAF